MVTTVGLGNDYTTLVQDLIELEYDAMAAYKSCIERLDNQQFKTQLQEFLHDHQQHVASLKECAVALNIETADGPDMKVALTTGKIALADIFGDDAILAAMKTNEDDTVMAYERACKYENLPQELRTVFQKGHTDELRHRSWMESAAKSDQHRAA